MKQTVYIASPESQQIHVWQLDVNGILTLLQIVEVPGQVQPISISYDKRFLYAGVRPNFCIITYEISSENGILKPVKEFPLRDSSTYISTDYRNNFMFNCSYKSNSMSVIALNNGIPLEIIDIIKGLEGCHAVNMSPDHHMLWVLALRNDRIYLFDINKNGKPILQPNIELKTTKGAGPRHMVFHPHCKYAYVINELHSSIDVWSFDNQYCNIKCIQTLDIMPTNFSGTRWASDIHITPNGHYLYACDRTSSVLTILEISEDGSTLSIKGFKPTEKQPRGFNIDNQGKFLISAGQKTHHISIYKIEDTQGTLKKHGRYAVGKGPTWVIVSPH